MRRIPSACSRLVTMGSARSIAKGRYLHWDQMRHRTPPDGLTLQEWWVGQRREPD